MNRDQLTLFGGLDQSSPADASWVLNKIDEIVQESIDKRDVNIALDVGAQIIAVGKISGLALAKLCYLVNKYWDAYAIQADFDDVVYPHLGVHPHTVERYIRIWKMFAEDKIPIQFEDSIQQHYMTELFPIANALEQGYEIDDETWQELSEAPDYATVSKIVREDVKDHPPRKNSIQIFIDNIGSLWAWKNGEKYYIGSLEVLDDEPAVQQSIARILRTTGIMKE